MPFTPAEKDRIKYHLSYPLVSASLPVTTQGVAFPTTLSFSIDFALGHVTSEAESIIRDRLLPRIECIEEKINKAADSLIVEQAGDVKFRGGEAVVLLRNEYNIHVERVADILGVAAGWSSYYRQRTSGMGRVREPC